MSGIGRNVDIGNSATIAATSGDPGAQTIENDLQPWTRRANLTGLGIKSLSRNRFAVPSAAVKTWPGEALDLTTAKIAPESCLRCRLDTF